MLLNRDGSKFYAALNLLSVTRDGNPSRTPSTRSPNGKRFLIGDADKLIDEGPHTYVLHYVMTRMAPVLCRS